VGSRGDEGAGDAGGEELLIIVQFPIPYSQQKLSNCYKRMTIVLIRDILTNMRKLMLIQIIS
jgi:hypothetical protein